MGRSERSLDEFLAWMRDGTAFFADRLARLRDPELSEPSALPDWSRAHVVAHVARNADALGNLLTWASTGVETPMYASAEQRANEIEAGAAQAPRRLRDEFDDAAARLERTAVGLAPDAWARTVKTSRGRAIAAAEVPWMRSREVWVHGVDLANGATLAGLPSAFVHALLDETVGAFAARPEVEPIALRAVDGGARWLLGAAGPEATTVEGSTADLLAWLLGRSNGNHLSVIGGADLPSLPVWL